MTNKVFEKKGIIKRLKEIPIYTITDKMNTTANKKQQKQQKQAEPVAEVEHVEEAVATTEATTSADVEVESYEVLAKRIEERAKQLTVLQKEQARDLQKLAKTHGREMKNAHKTRGSRAARNPDRQPSGFNKPSPVPDALIKFFGLTAGTEMARTKVTKELYEYIRNHNLQSELRDDGKPDKRIIVPDEKLRNLFGLKVGDKIEFKTFQTHVSKLYPQKDKTASAATDSAPAPSAAPAASEPVQEKTAPKAKSKSKPTTA